jgi:hypothetical protein
MSVYPAEMVPDLDLGDDHYLCWTRWEPDDLPANRAWLGIPEGPLPVVERWGAIVRHYRPDGTLCEGCITFDGEWQRRAHQMHCEARAREGKPEPPPDPTWTVESWEPLTCSPSLLCESPVLGPDGRVIGTCGDHGFIRNGAWVRA